MLCRFSLIVNGKFECTQLLSGTSFKSERQVGFIVFPDVLAQHGRVQYSAPVGLPFVPKGRTRGAPVGLESDRAVFATGIPNAGGRRN
jgi:hypothetical protein